MLARCLESLAAQIIADDIAVSLVVVDNDPAAGARLTVGRFCVTAPFPVCYVHEPVRGIACACNGALGKARELSADWMAIINDDETGEPDRIAELMTSSLRSFAVVADRREFVYPSVPSFWEKPKMRRATRSEIPLQTTSTCNGRFSRAPLDTGLRFDGSLGLCGGKHLSRALSFAVASPGRLPRHFRTIQGV